MCQNLLSGIFMCICSLLYDANVLIFLISLKPLCAISLLGLQLFVVSSYTVIIYYLTNYSEGGSDMNLCLEVIRYLLEHINKVSF